MNWHFSLVNKHYSASVSEVLATGEGTFDFNKSPPADVPVPADTAAGTVVLEYQQLKPRPARGMIRFKVAPGVLNVFSERTNGQTPPSVIDEVVVVGLKVTSSNTTKCKVGSTEVLGLAESLKTKTNSVKFTGSAGCPVNFSQRAAMGPNSRVHVIINGRCLRELAASRAACGGAAPTNATIEVLPLGAVRGLDIATQAQTCQDPGYPEGTSCFVNVPVGLTIQLRSVLDKPLPGDWSWKLIWNYTQDFPCEAGKSACTSPGITVTATPGVAQFQLTIPTSTTGVTSNTGATLVVQPCQSGQPANGHPCV